MSTNENSLAVRIQRAVELAGGASKAAAAVGVGRSTVYTWAPGKGGEPSIEEAQALAKAAGVSPAWLLLNQGQERGGLEPFVSDKLDTVEIKILTAPASAGAGSIFADAYEERGTVAFPRKWAREFGSPSSLRLVEIVGDSMSPDLDSGDWMLIDIELTDYRDGIAVIRLDEDLLVKRLHKQGRYLMMISSNAAYGTATFDLAKDHERIKVVGYGRWKTKRLP